MRLLSRALAAACVCAAAGVAALAAVAALDPDLTFDFDHDSPSFATGFYPVERYRDQTFAWTSAQASLTIPDLDRHVDWRCTLRLRGARPTGVDQPLITIAVDGVALNRRIATPDYEDVQIIVPARPSRGGLSLAIGTDPTFVPSPSDTRQLGAQVDRVFCAPESLAWPPGSALRAAGIAGAVFAVAFVLIGAPFWLMLSGIGPIAAAQAVALTTAAALYGDYTTSVLRLAALSTFILMAVVKATDWTRLALGPAARFVVAFSVAAVYIKLLALLHPAKAVVDAVFHAHRLDSVLDGHLYFTQPMPDGVAFPYAIGLYLFAAPFAWMTDNHVVLLRVVVTAVEAVPGLLLYPVIVRAWGDRTAAVAAVVLFHFVPIPYVVIGNANMTNAFGQSVAHATVVLAAILTLRRLISWQLAALTLMATLAYLSHVSIVTILPLTLVAMGALYWWRGGERRVPARAVLVASIAAGVLAVALYYAHFGDAYRSLARVRAAAVSGTSAAPPAAEAPPVSSIQGRAATALRITVKDLGWPLLMLAGVGVLRRLRVGRDDRLMPVVAAWAITYLVYVIFATMVPVGARFERYAAEFIGRLDLATYPAAVILAADAAGWLLRQSLWIRASALVLLSLAAARAVEQWLAWIR